MVIGMMSDGRIWLSIQMKVISNLNCIDDSLEEGKERNISYSSQQNANKFQTRTKYFANSWEDA